MSTTQKFSYLDHTKNKRDYVTEIVLHGQTVIPSDTFWLDKNEFVILDFPKKMDQIYIKILGIKGDTTGQIYLVPQDKFEDISIQILAQFRHF